MNITIVGPKGAMGSALIHEITKSEDFSLYSAIGKEGAVYIGDDAGIVSGSGKFLGIAITSNISTAILGSQMTIDFSTPESSMQVLSHAVQRKVPLVCGTTGFSREHYEKFQEAANVIPIVLASNTSRVVHLMRRLLAESAQVLADAEVEIIDMHARTKKRCAFRNGAGVSADDRRGKRTELAGRSHLRTKRRAKQKTARDRHAFGALRRCAEQPYRVVRAPRRAAGD